MAHLTTLAEDLEAIGLLPKQAPAAKSAPVEEAKKKAAAEECDDDDEMDYADDEEEVEEDAEVDENGDPLDEAARIRKRFTRTKSGAYKMTRTKRSTAAKRLKSRKYRRSAAGKKTARKAVRRMKTSKYKRFAAKLAAKHGEGLDRVAGLLDDVQKVLKDDSKSAPPVKTEGRAKLARGFAQLALTAELLAKKFESVDAPELIDLKNEIINDMQEMAKDYSDAAVGLKEGKIANDDSDLVEAFEEDVRDLLDALEVYDDYMSDDEGND